ncbi:hypothetical protein [Methanosarcina sp. MTP4]|uniref:hypothetical protein n=1 Tax=Methanosarcina sp. MTP4 TaxID=1434100 RepID=UPI00064FDFAE|nr:hypothetical protein [Methanosarcina sp. MTP4]
MANPNRLYLASWFGAFVLVFMLCGLFGILMPADTNFDDPVFEPIFTMIVVIPLLIVVLSVSIAVLKIKHRSMWWLLLFLWYSPLWLSDSKQQCKTNYIYAVLAFDVIFLVDGLTYFFECVKTNPLDVILWYGFFTYSISMLLAGIANRGLDKDNNLSLEDLTIHDAKDPEVKE